MGAWNPKIEQISTSSAVIIEDDGTEEVVTTVVVLLEDGKMYYTGTTEGAEWHPLPPLPGFRLGTNQ